MAKVFRPRCMLWIFKSEVLGSFSRRPGFINSSVINAIYQIVYISNNMFIHILRTKFYDLTILT